MTQPIFENDSAKFLALILPFIITGTTSIAIFGKHPFMWAFFLVSMVIVVGIMMHLGEVRVR